MSQPRKPLDPTAARLVGLGLCLVGAAPGPFLVGRWVPGLGPAGMVAVGAISFLTLVVLGEIMLAVVRWGIRYDGPPPAADRSSSRQPEQTDGVTNSPKVWHGMAGWAMFAVLPTLSLLGNLLPGESSWRWAVVAAMVVAVVWQFWYLIHEWRRTDPQIQAKWLQTWRGRRRAVGSDVETPGNEADEMAGRPHNEGGQL